MRQPTITVGFKKSDEKAHSVLFWASEKTLQIESVQGSCKDKRHVHQEALALMFLPILIIATGPNTKNARSWVIYFVNASNLMLQDCPAAHLVMQL